MGDQATKPHVVIERSVDAPADLVWAMWTDPAHFAQWYGPTGATITVETFDVRAGGSRLVRMEMPGPDSSREMWFAGSFLEVEPPSRLSYTEFMSDHRGNPREPFMTTEVRVALHPVDGRTQMVVTHMGIPADSPGATGWQMALDKLAAYVADTPAGKEPARTP